jgi:hypothetical protein
MLRIVDDQQLPPAITVQVEYETYHHLLYQTARHLAKGRLCYAAPTALQERGPHYRPSAS